MAPQLKERQKNRLDKIKQLVEGIVYAPIDLENSSISKDIIALDPSLNETGICIMMNVDNPDFYEENFDDLLKIYNIICKVMRESRPNDYIEFYRFLFNNAESVEINEYYSRMSNYNAELFIRSLWYILASPVISYDRSHNKIILALSIQHPSEIYSEMGKLMNLKSALNFITLNAKFIYNFFIRVFMVNVMGEGLSYLSDNKKEVIREFCNINKINMSNIVDCLIPEEGLDCRTVILEEVSSSANFTGMRTTALAYGCAKTTIYSTLLDTVSFEESYSNNVLMLSVPKSSLTGFVRAFLQNFFDKTMIKKTLSASTQESKVLQIALSNLLTGQKNSNDNIADAICYSFFCIYYVSFIEEATRVLLENNFIRLDLSYENCFNDVVDPKYTGDSVDTLYKQLNILANEHYLKFSSLYSSIRESIKKNNPERLEGFGK